MWVNGYIWFLITFCNTCLYMCVTMLHFMVVQESDGILPVSQKQSELIFSKFILLHPLLIFIDSFVTDFSWGRQVFSNKAPYHLLQSFLSSPTCEVKPLEMPLHHFPRFPWSSLLQIMSTSKAWHCVTQLTPFLYIPCLPHWSQFLLLHLIPLISSFLLSPFVLSLMFVLQQQKHAGLTSLQLL